MHTSLFDISQFTAVVNCDNEVCKCVDCDQDLDRDDVIEIDDSIYCNDCVDHCSCCDDAVLENDLTTVYTKEYSRESRVYCSSCIENDTFTCEDCGNYHSDDLSQYHIQDTDTVICSGCYEHNDYFYCSDCEEFYSDRSANYSDDGTFCNDCIGDHIKNENIKEYGYDPLNDLDFLGNPKDDLYLGLELEVYVSDDLNDTANTVSDLLEGYAILKEDGSISTMPGFEIVTAPASLSIHREKITEFFSSNPDIDTDDDHNIGLHIHISRQPLSQLTIGKLLVFINNPDNQDKIVAIAGRSSNQWAKLSPKKITDIKKQTSRYEAVNLQNNDTVEFRIFASTVDPKLILARLEFVHSLTVWVKDQSMLELTWYDFTGYIRENKALYPNLGEWLDNNN